jgi:hypothetical protein
MWRAARFPDVRAKNCAVPLHVGARVGWQRPGMPDGRRGG